MDRAIEIMKTFGSMMRFVFRMIERPHWRDLQENPHHTLHNSESAAAVAARALRTVHEADQQHSESIIVLVAYEESILSC